MTRARKLGAVAAIAIACLGCGSTPDIALDIRLPTDRRLLDGISQLTLSATRGALPLAQQSYPSGTSFLSVSGLSHGTNTVISLAGVDAAGQVIAQGRTCAFDYEGAGVSASLYFAPTTFFAPTVGAPLVPRSHAAAVALDDGTVLVAGGEASVLDGDGGTSVIGTTEVFSPSSARFVAGPTLAVARTRAEAIAVPSIGALVTGGLDGSGAGVNVAELYDPTSQQLTSIVDAQLDARLGHRLVLVDANTVLLTGGRPDEGHPALATTLFVELVTDGHQVSAGPPLAVARRDHAAVLYNGGVVLLGGYGADGAPLDSVEVVLPSTSATQPGVIGHLQTARAEATASLVSDGTSSWILVVGGVDASGNPLATAELFDPLTRTPTPYTLDQARRGHTATVLEDGRVLVAGGWGAANTPLAKAELFVVGTGFLSERDLGTARADHVAVPLCDGTVLLAGGGSGAELYTGPAD